MTFDEKPQFIEAVKEYNTRNHFWLQNNIFWSKKAKLCV